MDRIFKKGISNVVITVVALALVLAGGGYYLTRSQTSMAPTDTGSARQAAPAAMNSNAKAFEIFGKPFEFSLKEIKVKKGDTVRIVYTTTAGLHDWVVDEFDARTKPLRAGESETIEFVADKTGTFEYYCSVMTHRQQGMVGKLVVD